MSSAAGASRPDRVGRTDRLVGPSLGARSEVEDCGGTESLPLGAVGWRNRRGGAFEQPRGVDLGNPSFLLPAVPWLRSKVIALLGFWCCF
jgi:hypothetical protein